jgi:glycosyltransferase involved in cell wall biosynthesis
VKSIVCEDNREFIIARDDVPGFAAAITRLARDPKMRDALGLKNRQRVTAEFSQERMFSAYFEVFAGDRVP